MDKRIGCNDCPLLSVEVDTLCEKYCSDMADYKEEIRSDAIDECNKKIDYLKNCYVDACNMCTRMECDVCAISNFIEDLEQLKEQNNAN